MLRRIISFSTILVVILSVTFSLTSCKKAEAPEITTNAAIDNAAVNTCAYNKSVISSLIQSYCIMNNKAPAVSGDTFTVNIQNNVVKVSGSGSIGTSADIEAALGTAPACPSGGVFTINVAGTEGNIAVTVTCSIHS